MNLPTPILLAAGAANRFGGCKLLLEQQGKSLLQQQVDTIKAAGLPSPTIITGAWHEKILQDHSHLDLRRNTRWQQGIGSSIAFATAQLPAQSTAALIMLTDQVAIDSDDISALVAEWSSHGGAVCAQYEDEPGVPAIFPRALFPQLSNLSGDMGAKALLKKSAAHHIPMPHGAIDIDTREDWQQWNNTNNQIRNGETSWN